MSGTTPAGIPAGAMLDFAGNTAPAGYLLCAGQNVSRATYAGLFAAIGTAWGAGDGSTTFTLPDYRGRVSIGKDDMGGSAANRVTNAVSGITGMTVGAVGGDQRQHGHSHTEQGSNSSPLTGSQAFLQGANAANGVPNANNLPTDSVTAASGAGASQNMPPGGICLKIIKV